MPRSSRRRGRKRPWVLAAAAVLVVVGAAGVVRLTIGRPNDHTVAQQPVDPPGPLYVLPNDPEAWTVSVIGNVQTSEIDPYRSVVVGERTADRYANPVSVTIDDAPLQGFDETWESIELATGTAPSPLGAGSADFADAISPVEIDGHTGWRVTRHIRGNTTSLVWMATPNRMESVESAAPIDDLLTLAEDLQIVDEATWTAATS